MELNKYSMLSSERADGSNKFNENKFVFNHPFTHDECFNRLVKEAEKYNYFYIYYNKHFIKMQHQKYNIKNEYSLSVGKA